VLVIPPPPRRVLGRKKPKVRTARRLTLSRFLGKKFLSLHFLSRSASRLEERSFARSLSPLIHRASVHHPYSREYRSEMDISVSITFHIRQRARGARRNRAVTSIASARLSRGNMTSLAASCVDVGLHRSFNHITRLRRASVSPSFCLDLIE